VSIGFDPLTFPAKFFASDMVDFVDMIPYWERYADSKPVCPMNEDPPPKERHPFTGSYATVPVDPVDADVVPVLKQDAPTLVSDNCVDPATLLEQIVHKQFELLSQRFEQRFDRLEQQIKEIQQDNAQQFDLLEQKSEIVDQTLDALHLKCAILRSPLASPSDPAPPSISPVILNADPPVVALPDPALDQVALLASTAVPAPKPIPPPEEPKPDNDVPSPALLPAANILRGPVTATSSAASLLDPDPPVNVWTTVSASKVKAPPSSAKPPNPPRTTPLHSPRTTPPHPPRTRSRTRATATMCAVRALDPPLPLFTHEGNKHFPPPLTKAF